MQALTRASAAAEGDGLHKEVSSAAAASANCSSLTSSPGSTTTNSSPPRRPIRSDARRSTVRMRLAQAISTVTGLVAHSCR